MGHSDHTIRLTEIHLLFLDSIFFVVAVSIG